MRVTYKIMSTLNFKIKQRIFLLKLNTGCSALEKDD